MEFQRITHTVTRNHTRRNSEDTGILDIGRTTVHLTDDCLYIIFVIRTFVPRFQLQNQHTERASLSCQQSVAGHFLHVLNLRNIHQALFDAFHHFVGRSQRTTGRRTYIDEYHTLVFVRHQTGLRRVHQEYKQHYGANEQRPCQPSAFDKDQYHILVFLYQNIESRIECFTETCRKVILLCTVFIDIGFQQQRTQCRTQRQRINSGNTNGNRHRQTKLGIERTGSTAHEGYRNKYCHKHQRRGDNSITDTFHCIDTCHIGRPVPHVEACLHRLDDNNGVVHHRTDDEHECKQREQIDTESCHRHESKRTDERNNDSHQRNQRRTEVLQEHIYYKNDQDNRLDQRLHHLMDRSEQEVVRTHDLRQFHSFRKVFADFFK